MDFLKHLTLKQCKLILFVLGALLYANTIFNQYALDDSIVITENTFVQKGAKGIEEIFLNDSFKGFFNKQKHLVEGGRYRPLSIASFAIEKQLWGNKPGLSHAINALIYGIICLLLFQTIYQILKYFGNSENNMRVALLCGIIFTIHPVHTEVVANIKGRDELLSALFILLCINCCVQYFHQHTWNKGLLIMLTCLLGMLSKENAVFIVPIIIIIILLNGNLKSRFSNLTVLIFPVLGITLYLLLRHSATGIIASPGSNELMNNPYLMAEKGQKLPTILFTLLIYFKLLFIPHPLTYDYYPYHIQLVSWNSPWVLIAGILYLALFYTAFHHCKKNKALSLGIALYLVTLIPMSNLIVNIGSFMNERFLFLPSIGFALGIASILQPLVFGKKRMLSMALFLLILLLFSLKTIIRNSHWKNNYTLFTHDVKISSGSAKANCTAGGIIYEYAIKLSSGLKRNKLLHQSITYLNKAIQIYPDYIDALLLLGNAHYQLNKNIHISGQYYLHILNRAPGHEAAYNNFKKILAQHTNIKDKIWGYKLLIQYKPSDSELFSQLGSIYGKELHKLDSAAYYLRNAVTLTPNNAGYQRNLGVAYAMAGNYHQSLPHLIKADSLQPQNTEHIINLGITYQNLGKHQKARELFNQVEKLRSSSKAD